MELFQLADVLLSAPKPPPPQQTNASALCNFTRFTNGGAIHNEGRRCGLSTYPGAIRDTTTPMCLNTTKDGLLKLPESELQARCSEDAQCLGYFVDESARAHRHSSQPTMRPVAAWAEGARFPLGTWSGVRKECAGGPPLPAAAAPGSPLPAPAALEYPPPPWPALIMSSSIERFARAAAVAKALGFRAAHLASSYPPANKSAAWDQVTGNCPRTGYNGVRAAHRNAWTLIEMANTSMAVFEDDIGAVAKRADEARAFLATAARGGYDVAYLNEMCTTHGGASTNPFLSAAALWVTPNAASRFLRATSRCFPSDGIMKDIDKYTSRECFSHLRCLPALPLRRRGAFGCGLFSQDRHAVEPWRGQEYIRVGQ